MNPTQRSEVNNQTSNGGNEKGTPGSQGKTIGEAPLDHTYGQGASRQLGQDDGQMGHSTGTPSVKRGDSMGAEQRADRGGSQSGAGNYQGGAGTHQSNDTAGGLPRSPGNTGASGGPTDTHLTGAQVHANQQKGSGVHDSNDMAGGYPKSPGGANKLAADEKMDDDTGFSNKP
jgi:hypothetical protein